MRFGYLMDLNPDPWDKMSNKTRNTFRKALKSGVFGQKGTLEELRELHWEPAYLPRKLEPNQHIYVAKIEVENEHTIAAVLIETDPSRHAILYKYAASNPKFKQYQGNSFLIWYIAELHRTLGFKFIDLGGSRKKGIDRFKKQFATRYYPIFEKPKHEVILAKIKYHLRKMGVTKI